MSQGMQHISPEHIDYQPASASFDASPTPLETAQSLEQINFRSLEPRPAELVDMFFEHIYPVPSFSFLHPHSTREKAQDGSLDDALAKALCAVTELILLRHTPSEGRGTQSISAVEQCIWDQLQRPTLSRLQALILCVVYRMETGNFQRAFMLAGLAARGATAMRLNYEAQSNDAVICESRRRTLWSLKLLEVYFSIGLPENELLPYENLFVQFPMHEDEFQSDESWTSSERGSYGLFVRLASLRRDIMRLNRSIALCDQPFPHLLKVIRSLERELEHQRTTIGSDDSSFPEIANSSPWLARMVAAKLSWHQCHCDLYRLLLPGYPEAAPTAVLQDIEQHTTDLAIECCLTHALAIIQILCDINAHCTNSRLMEFDAAICGYHAARLVLFLAQSGLCDKQLSREYALSRAELCIASLNRFFRFSPPASPVISELRGLAEECASERRGQLGAFMPPALVPNSQEPQLSDAIRARQRLAIHSLLRHADFDEDISEESTSPTCATPGLLWDRQRTMQQVSRVMSKYGQDGAFDPIDEESPHAVGDLHSPANLFTKSSGVQHLVRSIGP